MIPWFENHRKLSILITIIIATTIFSISSISFQASEGGTNLKALAYHFFAFFFLAFFLFISTINNKKKPTIIFASVILSVLYAISDEIHQIFVPGRFASLSDVLVNTFGISFAFVIYFISLELRRKNYLLTSKP